MDDDTVQALNTSGKGKGGILSPQSPLPTKPTYFYFIFLKEKEDLIMTADAISIKKKKNRSE